MKTIYGSIKFGILLAVFITVGAATGLAQANCEDFDGMNELDTIFRENYAGNLEQRQKAVEAAKQYIEKYGSCEVSADLVEYFKTNLPAMEKRIADDKEAAWLSERFKRFDAGIKNQNYDEAFAAGKEILTKQPDNLNIIVPLGAIGLAESYEKNYKYNADSLNYAKMAIEKIESGVTSNKYGVFQFEYGTKENALSEMNYVIGYINYHVNNNKKAGVERYYKVSQMPGNNRQNPLVFETIGSYYFDEVAKLADEVQAMIAKQNAAETDEEKIAMDKDIKTKIGMLNGYAERAMDAFSRAHKVTKDDAASKEYKTGLFERIKTLYDIRFQKETGINEYMATTLSKPMPNPLSEVEPVGIPADPAETDGSDATSTAGEAAAVTKP